MTRCMVSTGKVCVIDEGSACFTSCDLNGGTAFSSGSTVKFVALLNPMSCTAPAEDTHGSIQTLPPVEDTTMAAPEPTKRVPISASIRYTALTFSCLLTFGGYLVFDLCSALQDEIKKEIGINDTQYSLLYVVYAWTNCLMVLVAGGIIDNTANRTCAMLFCTIAFLGQTVLSVGVQMKTFAVMVVGRTIFGMGLGSICVAQNTISNTYFRDADLATAFAATLTVSRLGSVMNFLLSTHIYDWFGRSLSIVFWWGSAMTGLSLLAAVAFFLLDRVNENNGTIVSASRKSRKIKWGDIMRFPSVYWVLCLICSLYYINIFCLMAVMVKFLMYRNELDKNIASTIASTIYFVAIPCVPFFGRLIDRFGHRMHWLAISVMVMVPFNIYLDFTDWTPIPILVAAGMSYSMVASSLWPSICLSVPDECIGTANGIATSIQMVGIGASNLIVGALQDRFHDNYKMSILYMVGCSCAALALAFLANVIDTVKFGGLLNNHAPLAPKKKEVDEKTPLVK
eukprot:m51a1_g12864 hypothetical protein (511) ;mRNA; r:611-3090